MNLCIVILCAGFHFMGKFLEEVGGVLAVYIGFARLNEGLCNVDDDLIV